LSPDRGPALVSAIECEKVISRSDIKLLDLQALEVARVDAPGRKVVRSSNLVKKRNFRFLHVSPHLKRAQERKQQATSGKHNLE